MNDFNESLAKAIADETQARVDLALEALSLPRKGKYRDDLKFSAETKDDLKRGFIAIRKERFGPDTPDSFLEGDAEGFVSMLERYAQGMEQLAAAVPDKQKRRAELLASISKQAIRMAEVLEELDREALGWMLAKMDETGNLEKDPLLATTRAEAQRQDLLKLLPDVSRAAQTASETLPSHNHKESAPKFLVAKQLEHTFWQEGMLDLFTPSKSGFAYRCLLEILALAGEDAGDPAYWIKQAREHAESMTLMIEKRIAK
jgi:hypothetical protein